MTYSAGKRPASRNNGPEDAEDAALWEGHRHRLRERMEREGWDALKPHEMVELVLYRAVPRQDVSDVSRLLVDRFGSVGGVFSASREELRAVAGMTDRLAEWVALTGELMRAYCDLHGQRDIRLGCYQDVLGFLEGRRPGPGGARTWALYADFDFNFITYADLDLADAWWDPANARRMLSEAIVNGARYVYLVLWDADGPDAMGPEELARLESIAGTLRAADLDLVDCVIVGDSVYSMNVHGRMEGIRAESGCLALHEGYLRD